MIFGNEPDVRDDANDRDALLLTSLRIYDTLMALLHTADADMAIRLHNLHAQGGLGAPLPKYDPHNIISE